MTIAMTIESEHYNAPPLWLGLMHAVDYGLLALYELRPDHFRLLALFEFDGSMISKTTLLL